MIATAVAVMEKLPKVEDVWRLVRAGATVLEHLYMDEVFAAFLALKKDTRPQHLSVV